MRSLVAIGLAVLLAHPSAATHIIGGELYYDHVAGDQFSVTLKIYRDCGFNNTNGTGFDPSVEIGVFDDQGGYLFSEFFSFPGATQVPVVLNNPCLVAPSTICVEEAQYTGIITLPSGTGGYLLAYQRCCRTPSILNLDNPGNQGLTCVVEVPDISITGPNSSPRFDLYPPIALCAAQLLNFDHSATDPDGDQLLYELAAPLDGASTITPNPSPPSPPPYGPVIWAPGYAVTNMINSAPPLVVDPASGVMQLTPTLIGSFVMGVRVTESRNGQVLSRVTRDLRFDVVNCQVGTVSAMQQQSVLCDGLTLDLVNLSIGNSYFWDFGVPGVPSDTSSLASPTFTYPDTGTYTVTLIADPGWPCADTSTAIFDIRVPLSVGYAAPPITCSDAQPIALQAVGNFSSAASIAWGLGPLGSAPATNGPDLLVSFAQPGTHVVSLAVSEHGCNGAFTDTVIVHPRPSVDFVSDTAGCVPLAVQFQDQSTAWTPLSYRWDLGDGATSTVPAPQHVYALPGSYDVSLTIATDSGCVDTLTLVRPGHIRTWPLPVARLFADPLEADILDPVVTFTDASINAVSWSFALDGVVYEQPSFTHTFSDGGVFPVELTVTSGPGCEARTSISVLIRDHLFYAPNSFTPNGDDVNETWTPQVFGARLYDLAIFDRWGQKVFHTTDPSIGWDGGGGVQGTYTYRVQLAEYGPLDHLYTGVITLIR